METNIKTLQANLLWTGIEYYSLENCQVSKSDTGYEVNSVILGFYEGKIYRVNYLIKTSTAWETLFVDISCQHENSALKIHLESDGKGNWRRDGQLASELEGCIDVDIRLTPFTNTLPINRLKLALNEKKQIRVIYLDLLNKETKVVFQNYMRSDDSAYQYENVHNDFEATISVDEEGFVVHYPELFTRKAKS